MALSIRQYIARPRAWWARQSTRRKGVFAAIVTVIILVILKGSSSSGTATIETVKRQNLTRTVVASGTVVSSTDLSLGFEQSKMVVSVRVKVGDRVKKGDILASLSNGTERAAVTSAKGALLAARARYNKVLEGSSNEEIKLAQTQYDNARRTMLSDGLVARPEDADIAVSPIVSGAYTGTEGVYRLEFSVLAQNTLEYSGIEKGKMRVDESLPQKLGTKGLFIQFTPGTLDQVAHGSVWVITIPNVESTSYVANRALVDEKQAALDVAKATARQPDIDAALADFITAQAGVDSAVAALERTMLRAPADGTITAVDVKVGEIPVLGTRAIAIQDVSNLYLEANVNESDIKNIVIGQPVTVTFDAFPGTTYTASVSSVDPAATIENNVVNYKIKALLVDTETIRPGMTANMTILTASVDNTLVLPARVISQKDGVQSVQLVTDERRIKTMSQTITTGLRGDGDLVEIQSGLSEGDRVLWDTTTP